MSFFGTQCNICSITRCKNFVPESSKWSKFHNTNLISCTAPSNFINVHRHWAWSFVTSHILDARHVTCMVLTSCVWRFSFRATRARLPVWRFPLIMCDVFHNVFTCITVDNFFDGFDQFTDKFTDQFTNK